MAKQGNIDAIIRFGTTIAGTLQNINQQRWVFAIEKARMSREERIRQDELTFARRAATSLATQKQAEAKAKATAGRESLLGNLMRNLKLNDKQRREVLDTGTFSGEAKIRPTEHISRQIGGRAASLPDARKAAYNEIIKMRKKNEDFETFVKRLKIESPQSFEIFQRLFRSPSIIDMIQGLGLGQQGQAPPPPGLQ